MRTKPQSGLPSKLKTLLAWFLWFTSVQAQLNPTIVWQSKATNGYILNPLAISPDGTVAATLGTNNSIQIWRLRDGVASTALHGNTLWVGALAFSPDGTLLASGGGDKTVRVWRTMDWSLAYLIPTSNQGPPVAFSKDSDTLAVGNGKTIELRRALYGTLFKSWTATLGEMRALAFSPDGKKLASGAGFRGADTTLKIWDAPSGALIHSVQTSQTYGIGQIAFSPDSQSVVTGSEYLSSGPMQSWRVADGALLRTFPIPAYGMAFSSDGNVLAAVGTNIVFFRAANGAVVQEYPDGFSVQSQGMKGIALTTSGYFIRSRSFGEVSAGRIPTVVSPPEFLGGKWVIRWLSGPGPFRLQRATEIGGEWKDVGGILTTNSVEINQNESNNFFRVIGLP